MTDFTAYSTDYSKETAVLASLRRSARAAVERRKTARARRRAETFAKLLNHHKLADLGLSRMYVAFGGE